MSFDPDDDRWAARAAEVATLDGGEFTIRFRRRSAEFMNPWHDEIGRFAPKGTGRRFDKGGGKFIPGVGDVDEYLAAHPQLPGEAIFVWHGRLVDGLPPVAKHALLFEIRERYEPVDYIADGMKRWREQQGLPEPQVAIGEIPANQAKAFTVARVFEEMPDQSGDPKVQAAFAEFKQQSEAMWDFMTRPESEGGLGITVEFWESDDPTKFGEGPYPDATAQAADLRENRHIYLESGLGGAHEATMTREEYDRFRAVHDVFGHAGIGSGFDRHGEYQAYLAHASMYSGDGRRAMASEYHGVNSAAWSGEPGSPGTGKSVLLPEVLIENPWDESGAMRPVPSVEELQEFLPDDDLDDLALVAAGSLQREALNIDEETAAAVAYLAERAGIQHPFAQAYDPSPFHHVALAASAGQFANPWHDEIGRFAPKGYVRSGNKISRKIDIPRSAADGDAVIAAMRLFDAVDRDLHPVDINLAMGRLVTTADYADQDLVESYLKPAARAIADDDMQEAHRLISEADKLVFTQFTEKFEVPEPEKVDVAYDEEAKTHYTVTPEGNLIMLHPRGHTLSDDQVQTILSAATTAARAGKVNEDVQIQIQGFWNHEDMRWETQTMGFVNVDPTGDSNRHRVVQLTPQLINGNFDPDGSTPRSTETITGSAAVVEALRATVLHEFGHVSLYEEALVHRGGTEGKEWFNEQMTAIANNTTNDDIPFMSDYAQQNTVEMHAEAFMEWTNTGGTTNNPWVRRVAEQFGWAQPQATIEEEPLAAAGPPREPLIPIFEFPDEPVAMVDGPDHASYVYGPAVLDEPAPLVASVGEFMNPWHDEIGRFAPKGTGTKISPVDAADDVLAGRPVEIDGVDAPDLVMQFADLDHAVDLTLVTVDGSSSMFSEMREKGRSRAEMPQVPSAHHAEFEERLVKAGVAMLDDEVDPRLLIATQSELDGRAVGQMVRNKREGGWDYLSRPLLVSSDGHLLDGHHRWAAAAVESAACDGCVKMRIIRVDMPINELLTFADDFTDELDIRRLDVSEHRRGGGVVAAGSEPKPEGFIFATDEEDGITDEQLADLPHGDGSAFNTVKPVDISDPNNPTVVASPGEFMNPWHDEIGRFAPKGTGRKVGFDREKADDVVDAAQRKLEGNADYLDEAYRVHYERGEESESTFNQARDRYLQYGSTDMDRLLRKNGDAEVADPAHRRALLDASVLDEAMARGGYRTPNEEIVMLRGIRGENAKNIVAGTRFIDPGFVSVTASPGEAAQAAGKGGGVLVALRIPAHTKALAGSQLEQEIILPRGGEYIVRNVTEGKDGLRIAEVEVKFPAKPPVTPGLPTVHDMVSEVSRQRQRKLQRERPLAASPGGNIVHERLSWDLNEFDIVDGAMTLRRRFGLVYVPERITFANPWHDEVGRFAPKGTGTKSTGAGPSERAKKALAPGVETIKLTDIGIEDATPEQARIAQSTRDDDALWETAEPRQVSSQDQFIGTEGSVKAKHVRKVVIDGEPLREGYPPRLYEMPDGSYLIADGHHRVVMHNMLESPAYEAIVLPYPKDKR